MESDTLEIESPNLRYSKDYIEAKYTYQTTSAKRYDSKIVVTPKEIPLEIRTARHIPRLGVMLVGWGGNNGTTFTAGLLAHKLKVKWNNKLGEQSANWFGSITQSSTLNMGYNETNQPIYIRLASLLPFADPDNIVLDGWDISSLNLADSMKRSAVIDYELQKKLKKHMEAMSPRPSIYYPDYIASNQTERADNVIKGCKWDHLLQIQEDIRDCKEKNQIDKIIVLWTANTERFSEIVAGVNDSGKALLNAIKNDSPHVAPSTVFAVASVLEGCTFINGSPQNTFVPGIIDLAEEYGTFLAGDDFKSGQTKLKSVLVDFLVSAGIKPLSIASYNHLGNNDGLNLSSPQQFKSKEISKSNVIDDMVSSNRILFKVGETPDHCVVIKYIPAVGDSKRAMDEYSSELMLGGRNTLVIHNTCEDSLLAAPIMLDLVLIAEISQRIQVKEFSGSYTNFHQILSILSYLLKAPVVAHGTPVVNSLFRQKTCIENIFRACLSLPPENNMLLEFKVKSLMKIHLSD